MSEGGVKIAGHVSALSTKSRIRWRVVEERVYRVASRLRAMQALALGPGSRRTRNASPKSTIKFRWSRVCVYVGGAQETGVRKAEWTVHNTADPGPVDVSGQGREVVNVNSVRGRESPLLCLIAKRKHGIPPPCSA